MVFRINEGTVNDVGLSGVAAGYVCNLPPATYAEVHEKGSEGAIYISDHTTPEQRNLFDTFTVRDL